MSISALSLCSALAIADSSNFFIITAPSGAGKSSLIKSIIEEGKIELSVSATTREPRINEVHERDYSFLSINEFQKLNKLEITEVTSPTFNLLNEYQINEFKINHYDLFRLKSTEEIKNLDLFDDKNNLITLIEWPELIEKKPKNLIELIFKYEQDYQARSVQIKGF